MEQPRFLTQEPRIEMMPGVTRRTLGITDAMMLVEIQLDAGAIVPEHSHPHEQVGYVVAGALRLKIGDEEQLLKPGDGYAIPGDVPHSAVATEATTLIDVFSPPREAYRPEHR